MATIVVVAPYQEFATLFKQVFASHSEIVGGEETAREETTLELVVEYDQELIQAMRPVGDVVIARGFSAEILRRNQNLPVVEVPVLLFDIIRSINRARELYGNRKIVFPATSNMYNHVDVLSQLLQLDIQTIHMPSTMGREPEIAFEKIPDKDCIIIGGKPICLLADELGYDNVIIESGPEAMRTALSEAKRIAYVRRQEQEKAQSFKTILDYNADGIVALDKDGRCTSINAMARSILEINDTAVGCRLQDVVDDAEFTRFLTDGQDCADEVARFGNKPLVINKTGIFLADQRIGTVVNLQYVSKIQNSEKNIRNKIMERGLVARHTFSNIYGKSQPIRAAIQTAHKYSRVDASVLIVGKNGTGKELFAQSMHNASPRYRCPFVAINCAAIPDNLLESELFGYVEGAFTGASKGGKIGLIEQAHEGTLFLDEISEMPLSLQGRLLRVLQEKEIRRLGSDKVTRVSIRVISATNRDLFALVEANRFREDLYYRLAVLTLNLPALHDRREDIPGLVDMFLSTYRPDLTITSDALALLQELSWQGNIRELRNACEQLAVLCETDVISIQDVREILAEKIQRQHSRNAQASLQHPQAIKDAVIRLLAEGHSKSQIASILGINRSTLWRKMRQWNL